ncbi:hypothetical protein ABBQ38_15554 [Trebouxia sp. C0009 RCD-2024]
MYASCDKPESLLLHAVTMRLASLPGALPERSWNLVKHEASQLSKLALCLMGVSVNAAGCDRSFSQMGLTHTKLRNRLGWAKTTHIAQLRQELHRDRPKRKRARVLTAVDSAHSAAAENSTPTEDSLMDALSEHPTATISTDTQRPCPGPFACPLQKRCSARQVGISLAFHCSFIDKMYIIDIFIVRRH